MYTLRNGIVRVEDSEGTLYASIDVVADKLERKMVRIKERAIVKGKWPGRAGPRDTSVEEQSFKEFKQEVRDVRSCGGGLGGKRVCRVRVGTGDERQRELSSTSSSSSFHGAARRILSGMSGTLAPRRVPCVQVAYETAVFDREEALARQFAALNKEFPAAVRRTKVSSAPPLF